MKNISRIRKMSASEFAWWLERYSSDNCNGCAYREMNIYGVMACKFKAQEWDKSQCIEGKIKWLEAEESSDE